MLLCCPKLLISVKAHIPLLMKMFLNYPSFFFQEKILQRQCHVIVVSFGVSEGVKKWKEITSCSFDIYRDPSRKFYNAFAMKRSVAQVVIFHMRSNARNAPYKQITKSNRSLLGRTWYLAVTLLPILLLASLLT